MLRGIFTGFSGKFIKILELLMCDIERKKQPTAKVDCLNFDIYIFLMPGSKGHKPRCACT